MNILLASSRRVGTKEVMDKEYPLRMPKATVRPGASLIRLNHIAKTELILPRHTSTPTHVYIITGIPDITVKLNERYPRKYTECIYRGDPITTVNSFKLNMNTLADTLTKLGATPIFCTIPGTNIRKYNNFLHNIRHKTCELRHESQYDAMQSNVDDIILQLNEHIKKTNISKGQATPCLHTAIRKRRGKGYYVFDWEGLYDGIHATDNTRAEWAKSLNRAIEINRGFNKGTKRAAPPHTNTTSPKRSWKNERKNNPN